MMLAVCEESVTVTVHTSILGCIRVHYFQSNGGYSYERDES